MFRKLSPNGGVFNLFHAGRRELNFVIVNRFVSKSSGDSAEPDISKLLDDAATFNDTKNSDWVTTPYPATVITDSEKPAIKPVIDPKNTSILLFPGQGILKVGKIKEYMRYPRVKDLFEIANEALGYNIRKLCESGPQQTLNETEYNQPATVLTSLAAVEKLQEERPQAIDSCVAVAGYSVGEITALIFTGAITFEAGIRLVGVRAAAMQKASNKTPQGMLSVYCTPTAKMLNICNEAEKWAMDLGVSEPVCRIAIYLYTQGKILAGSEEALKYIEKHSKKMGLRQLKRLSVSGAFHTSLMQPAIEPFRKALTTISFNKPVVPVYSNYSAKPYTNEKDFSKYLIKQIVSPVKWEQILQTMYQRPPGMAFPRTFDVGSPGTMKTILRMVNAKAWDSSYIV